MKPICSIDGKWGKWENWSVCSKSCGMGSKIRERKCNSPSSEYGGRFCFGDAWETMECHATYCPIDHKMTEWSTWSSCSKTCGPGIKKRSKKCIPHKYNGRPCPPDESMVESKQCLIKYCPIHGKWKKWGNWSDCSVTCGNGTQTRYRDCSSHGHGGKDCWGKGLQARPCQKYPCKSDNKWSNWNDWTSCSTSCGDGIKTRLRVCKNSSGQFSKNCQGNQSEKIICHEKKCAIDGNWSNWADFTPCSVTCGQGRKMRDRLCNNPAPQYGGKPCQGEQWDKADCYKKPCKTDGNWSNWVEWSDCSKSCGNGTKTRTRSCDWPPPSNGGKLCSGLGVDKMVCSRRPCPINGGFTEWAHWSTCSVHCFGDRGDQVRRRYCTNPHPRYGGRECMGSIREKRWCTGHLDKQENDRNKECYYIGDTGNSGDKK